MIKHRLCLPLALVATFTSGAAHAVPVYWNLFNFEQESALDAIYVTYGSLTDMLTDTNRTGSFTPSVTGASAANVVGSGAFTAAATQVPEPGTLGLVIVGLLGLGTAGFKRSRSHG
ncbi:PEP-CTERM sorting domain-containing protein [Marinobacter sp. 71-i]|uniref:PEP-CTERM sorting domain-containing protein n=1 Tax=Marinobacter iranensis TaxID=2962607 RepID=A0ABT5YI61_9GAMM|nr:PEP-CTERM sorting domain-containing protein [Marinobacter iranensis]MDF0752725.1 PEP-CTERM sorting domain-containing protein [Marinobacter iranensis]